MTNTTLVEIEERKGYLWISFPSSINRDNVIQIRNRIESEIEGKQEKVVLDLSSVKAADSIVINLIVNTRNKIEELKGTLSLVNLTKNCLNLFNAINLDKVLTIYQNEEELFAKNENIKSDDMR